MKVNKKLIGVIVLIMLGIFLTLNYGVDNLVYEEEVIIEDKYEGPVPEGYNKTHFRLTGETILEVNG